MILNYRSGERRGIIGTTVVAVLLGLTIAQVVLLVGRVVYYYPENHGGIGILPVIVWSIIATCVAFACVITRRCSITLAIILIMAALVLTVTVLVLDSYNLLVEYNVWLKRGMPGPKW